MASEPKHRLTVQDYLDLERQALELPAIGCTLAFADIYEDVLEDGQ